MASDSPQTEKLSPVKAARACDKARLRFSKGGNLRFVSHRDLMKCFERILRRAELPVHQSQGFHPMPRMVFAMSLGLGILGTSEVLELEFDEPMEPAELQRRLEAQMPRGLVILSVRRIAVGASARVRRAGYRVAVPPALARELPARIEELLVAKALWVERTRPAPRRLDLRPYLSELRLSDTENGMELEMLLWVTPNGAARPDEILGLLHLSELVDSGVPVERHVLELHDEIQDPGPLPEILASRQLALPRPEHQREPAETAARPTALISGPLSFDS
jgi:radical SAM-linked protein